MKSRIQILTTLTILFLFLLPCLAHAQPGFGDTDDGSAPIDGGLSLLAAAGVGYGLKKMRKRKD